MREQYIVICHIGFALSHLSTFTLNLWKGNGCNTVQGQIFPNVEN